ncbi:MAG: T9SS C-terminal target domain-containing protein [Bacteroidia bacterium]|nr:T9SS C-terminal target domain-containing protein [Bacteroidia bacterium]
MNGLNFIDKTVEQSGLHHFVDIACLVFVTLFLSYNLPVVMNVRPILFISILFVFQISNAQNSIRSFIFGHSLIHHELQVNPTPSQETSVPHWLHFLAEEAEVSYAMSGQYGFIPQHANLPPFAQWGFDHVTPAWDSDSESFSEADFDNIMITPGNFIQWQGPSVNYYQDTLSPLDYTNRIFNWVKKETSDISFYVYENWPDMGPYLASGFPPTAEEWKNYNDYLQNDFHTWFLEYHDSLRFAHPDHCVRMIPVGPIISELLQTSPYNTIPVDSLYEDDAPHGKATTYFLAAMVTYMALYEQPTPNTYKPPSIIEPLIADRYENVRDFIWTKLLSFTDSSGHSKAFCSNPAIGGIEASSISTLRPFPNPFNDKIQLQYEGELKKAELVDAFGRTLVSSTSGNLNTEAILPGSYWILIQLSDGTRHVSQVIKY